MKNLFRMAIVALVVPLLGGCLIDTSVGSSAPPPPWAATTTSLPYSPNPGATAGDGRVELQWVPTAGVEYWVFSATDPSLTAFNWTGLPNAKAVVAVPTPTYMCSLIDNSAYYFATNGRINGGPGGPSSSTITATPYNATANWQPNGTAFTANVYGLGYTSLTTCANNTALSATGTFAAVGAGGAIFTSPDGKTWTQQTTPAGFSANLNAVTGYAAYQNNAITPGLRWVAVGDGGTAVYSIDGINWTAATAIATATTQNLRSIIQFGGGFYAVGDAGTIVSSSDGNSWSAATSGTTNMLNGIAHAGYFVAVGNNGTILTNGGSGWVAQTSNTASNLRQVAAIVTVYGSIYVAVGAGGTIVTSNSGLLANQWANAISPTVSDLVGVTVEPRGVETTTAYTTAPLVDPWLGFISAAQFVAMDSAGNTYTSVNGHDWTASVSTGMNVCTATPCMNPLISSGFGYIAAGDNGTTAYAF